MCFVVLAHHRAFPYQPYTHGNTALRTSLLADHLALEDAMRDLNEVMPVVLPTPFKPNAATLKAKHKYDVRPSNDLYARDTMEVRRTDSMHADAESDRSGDARGSQSSKGSATRGTRPSRGWRL
ncbi:hypothetical protein PsorP6_000476 [Peronosclerospora sorghi]|uniref:Uncharacterized protein n=1 Tax=Peronosclerospora sorghi TaxID=230839 RepID=A0ACC0WSC2_9STRA|nr:hypothetical protein PsorP6_000476 [Peronosclerospora sorghi]